LKLSRRNYDILKKVIVAVLIILLIVAIRITVYTVYGKNYESYVQKYSREYNIDENLIYAIIRVESKFKKQAISHKGAKGLMQVMDETAKWIAYKNDDETENLNIYDVETNIKYGSWYISYLLDKYDDNVDYTVMAYNAGQGNVDKWIESNQIYDVPFEETRKYVKKVNTNYKIYNILYGGSNES